MGFLGGLVLSCGDFRGIMKKRLSRIGTGVIDTFEVAHGAFVSSLLTLFQLAHGDGFFQQLDELAR